MRSTFLGLDTAIRGLFVAQRALDVTSHNVSNADTEGYTRQRLVTASVEAGSLTTRLANTDRGATGRGVMTLSLDQIRDVFLDRQYRQENCKTEYYAIKSQGLDYIENIFSGTTNNSLDQIISDLFDAFGEEHKNTTDKEFRTMLRSSATQLTDLFHFYYQQAEDLMYQQDASMQSEVKHVNSILGKISSLNENIFKFEMSGNAANDLRDKRNDLLDELSGYMNITYEEVPTGKHDLYGKELSTFVVKIDGETLVDHDSYRELICEQDLPLERNSLVANMDSVDSSKMLSTIRFADTGIELNLQNGKLKAYMDIRDGDDVNNQGIPYFVAQLDKLALALVQEINAVHTQGFTVPYTDSENQYHGSVDGVEFFDSKGTTARTINLSADILASEFNIASSSAYVRLSEVDEFGNPLADDNTANNEIGKALMKLKERKDIDVISGFETFYKSFIGEMASEVGKTRNLSESQDLLLTSIENQRLSVSQVSTDEEMTNLLRFQKAYSACSRVLNAMDDVLDTLINRTGRVGL